MRWLWCAGCCCCCRRVCLLTLAPNGAQHAIHAHALHGLHGCGLSREIEGCGRVEDCRGKGGAICCGVDVTIVIVDVRIVAGGGVGNSRSVAAQRQWRRCRCWCWFLIASSASRLQLLQHWHSHHALVFRVPSIQTQLIYILSQLFSIQENYSVQLAVF